jgi:hypothetical protein
MKRPLAAVVGTLLIGVAGWQGALAWQAAETETAVPETEAATPDVPEAAAAPKPRNQMPVPPPLVRDETPMADRVATLGLLNKRNGIARDITLRPGQSVRVGDVIVRLRACETTDPSEPEQLTGAFVQTDIRGRDNSWRRIFSGWLYKESPSLNVVESGLYDVWPKSCVMRHPDIGPETVSAGAAGPSRRSSAKKSTERAGPEPAPEPTPSAASSSPT